MIDEVNRAATRAKQIEAFFEAENLRGEWASALLSILEDPDQVARLRELLVERRAIAADPLDVLVGDHLQASESYRDSVGFTELYRFYVGLCNRVFKRPRPADQVEALIRSRFPDALRRYDVTGASFARLRFLPGGINGAD